MAQEKDEQTQTQEIAQEDQTPKKKEQIIDSPAFY
jgi:hypothetical protein